jgi:hypothetical protein
MFVRFRVQYRRLQASLVESKRRDGKMVAEHIGGLGSVDSDLSVRERLTFWAKLPARLAKLGNRVGPDDHAKIYGALHARIPMVTPDEQRALQEENAKGDERFWEAMEGMAAGQIEGTKALIATAEKKIAELKPQAVRAAENLSTARDRIAKLGRGERVDGGLGKAFDVHAALRAMGWAKSKIRHAIEVANLTEAEFSSLSEGKLSERIHAESEKASRREVRRILAARER